jgi:hypothetical protein
MDKTELAMIRAEEASRILGSRLWADAWEETRLAILNAWEAMPSDNREQSAELHRSLKNLARVKRVLETHIQTGKIAAKELEGQRRNLLTRFMSN